MRSSFSCDRPGTRTRNLLIKSQLLCQIELVGHAGQIIPQREGLSTKFAALEHLLYTIGEPS